MPRKRLLVSVLLLLLLWASTTSWNFSFSPVSKTAPVASQQMWECFIYFEFADEAEFVDAVAMSKKNESTRNAYVNTSNVSKKSQNIECVSKYYRFSSMPSGYRLARISTMDTNVYIDYWRIDSQQPNNTDKIVLHLRQNPGWYFLSPSREYRTQLVNGTNYVFDDTNLMTYFELDGDIVQMRHPAYKSDEELIELAQLVERVDVD